MNSLVYGKPYANPLSFITKKWQGQYRGQPKPSEISEICKPYRHFPMSSFRPVFIRPENTVPPGKIETEIAVSLTNYY
jgi:hypothetical protein